MQEVSKNRNVGVQVSDESTPRSDHGATRPVRQSARALEGLPAHLMAALKKQWKSYRKELKHCQKRFSEESVHQSRIETRRLLSLVELLGAFLPARRVERIRACLKRHLDTFDELRDTHVQLLLLKRLRDDYPEAKALERHLRRREKRFDRQTRKDIKRIKSRRLGRLIPACRKELRALEGAPYVFSFPHSSADLAVVPPQSLVLQAIDAAFNRSVKLRNRIDPEDTKSIHRTRVAFKKFRYMVEMLCGVLATATPRQLVAMRRYQGLMGDIQDMEVLIRAFEKFSRKKPPSVVQYSALRGRLLARRQQLIERYLLRADKLYSFWQASPPFRGTATI